jgi:F5/8 type C domain
VTGDTSWTGGVIRVVFMSRQRSSRRFARSHPRVIVVAVVLLGLLAACGSSETATSSASVQPFSKVQAGKIAFERDPSDPSRGIFHVTTTEPMICAIVWGTTDSFGRFNNSLSMNGTGIEQHDVRLPDVEPAVAYRYVVQGTTADGTLYRSKIGTFSIDAAKVSTPAVDHGPNLASDATVVDVSSEFSKAFSAANALDGDASTEWATRGDGDQGFITIDLGGSRRIGGVEFLTRSMADGSAITDTFTVAVDGGAPAGPFPAGTIAQPRFAPLDVTGQRLRFGIARSSGGNVGAVEIRVFGPTP